VPCRIVHSIPTISNALVATIVGTNTTASVVVFAVVNVPDPGVMLVVLLLVMRVVRVP
jgi:hypothetical protein